MRYEDEQYVRVYTRDTTNWLLLPWEATTVLLHLLRKLDRAGLLDLGEHDVVEAVRAQTQLPHDVVQTGLHHLFANKTLLYRRELRLIIAPNFIEAQEARSSDKARKRASREKARAIARIQEKGVTFRDILSQNVTDSIDESESTDVTNRDSESQNVTGSEDPTVNDSAQDVTNRDSESQNRTKGHTRSHAVTRGHSELSRAEPSREDLRDPNLKPDPDQNRDPDLQQPARARAREGLPGEPGTGLDRTRHPDAAFTNRETPIELDKYIPSQWLLNEAFDSGLDPATVNKTLARYQERSTVRVAAQSSHDKAFQGWLRRARNERRPSTPPRSNGSSDEPFFLRPPETRGDFTPEQFPDTHAGLSRIPPWVKK